METPSVVHRGNLSGLTTSNHISRRDSISSARTRDSGYNSDLEFSFSPIECLQSSSDLRFLVTPPALSDVEETTHTLPFRNGLHKTSTEKRYITSNPVLRSEGIPECSHILNSPAQDDAIETWAKDNLRSQGHPRERLSSIASLSSASSCDMYTNTDDSNDEGDGDSKATQANLPASTRRSIAHVMRRLDVDLRQSAYKQCYGGSTSAAHGGVVSTSQQGDGKGAQGGAKRKARADDHLSPDDNDDDGTNKRRRSSLANSNGSEPGTMFACPFFKHDPTRYRNRRTCLGPGWPSVHRVKEHLYRAHVQSIYCPRCYSMFDSDSDLNTHLRSQQCQVSAAQPVEGIDRETLKALRKRSPALRLEEDKWRDMYHLLFPQVPLENIPSPFYNEIAPNESSRRFRRELLRRVHQELITRAGQLPRPVEQRLLRYVAGIVQSVEDDLVNSFHSSDLSVPSPSDRRESVTSTNSTSSSQGPPHITTPPTMPMAHPGPSTSLTTPQVDPVVFDLVTWGEASTHNAEQVWPDWAPGFPDSDEQLYKDQYDGTYTGPSMELWH